ncbi:hypothetical protein CC1G_11718 [Coprinopsis cinerea okayama7|uniref:DUF1996 domain-containing protein n=1 Tax=Coprinopsis cinerea (strain Okayama-7 / 130 / ATCC MYA-4618 / FGSC 9003) TaxID=240176 RepID=A8NJW5_COPC7|nr:hypothetical protein CC1G_11718 [Coprinopsis cinerea okayama7\|eukprot:XP_001834309.2 hypothetical protein CC1G_11718 [Coprinopsis cinerea okayama7\
MGEGGWLLLEKYRLTFTRSLEDFNLTMDPDLDLASIATCTTCRFKENKSNYWTAVLYFHHPNGSFIRVPQMPNHLVGNHNGGMTVYYLPGAPPFDKKITAFPKGFRMITGNPMKRTGKPSSLDDVESYSLSFRCWEDQEWLGQSNQHAPGVGAWDTVHLPKKPCLGGIRSNTFFPSCWDGVNTDSRDHKSHMAFPLGRVDERLGIIWHEGECPETHPVKTPTILFEISWDTRPFNHMWPEDGSQPFVLSQGDPTGYGHHGDYLFGWEGDSLQRAMDNCFDYFGWPEACEVLTLQTDEEMDQCVKQTSINEVTEGEWLPELPGCNPIQHGPEPATMVRDCKAISTTGIPAATRPPVAGVTPAP